MEILLIDWIPRKIVGPAEYLSLAPELLRAFIRFAHAEVGVRPELTHESLAAIDDYEPEYQQTIRSPRPQGPAALLAAMGVDVGNATGMDFGTNESGGFGQMILDTLAREVGDRDALDQLDDYPLLDEAFGWEGIDDDVAARVGEVLKLTDRCCVELLDTEYRTACRRLLARAASGDAGVFRRGPRGNDCRSCRLDHRQGQRPVRSTTGQSAGQGRHGSLRSHRGCLATSCRSASRRRIQLPDT